MAQKNVQLVLKDVRLSFVHVFEPQEMVDKDTGKVGYTYNLNALIPKKLPDGSKNPQIAVIQAAMKTALDATWPGQNKVIPPERRCMRDGEPIDPDTVDEDVKGSGVRKPLYDGYEGHVFVSANRRVKTKDSPNPVQVLGPKKTAKNDKGEPCFPKLSESDGLIYSGCYATVIVNIYGYDGKKDENPDRINASLEVVQFRRHGEAFGAKPVDANAVLDEAEDDDFEGAGGAVAADDDEL